MVGDFNLTERHKAYRKLVDAGLQDAFRSVTRTPGYTVPARLAGIKTIPLMRIDYIWATSQFRPLRAWVGSDAGSDHLPVMAQLVSPRLDSEGSDSDFAG